MIFTSPNVKSAEWYGDHVRKRWANTERRDDMRTITIEVIEEVLEDNFRLNRPVLLEATRIFDALIAAGMKMPEKTGS